MYFVTAFFLLFLFSFPLQTCSKSRRQNFGFVRTDYEEQSPGLGSKLAKWK